MPWNFKIAYFCFYKFYLAVRNLLLFLFLKLFCSTHIYHLETADFNRRI